MTRRFKPVPTMRQGINISDTVIVIEGGLPDWRNRDEAKERDHYMAMKARYGDRFTNTAEDLPGCEMDTAPADAPLCDAFATDSAPLNAAPAMRTVRRFTARPRAIADEGSEVCLRFTVRGGLPDWRHVEENLAIARAEYAEQQKQTAAVITPTHAPDASKSEASTYQQAKDGELPLAEKLTPAEVLTIKQLMDPDAFKPVPPTGEDHE
jgi:hypothetical protein